MKGFTDTTKTIAGHNFPRTAVAVGAHSRAMPVKTPQMPMAQPSLAVTPPSAPSATGLSPTGFPPRQARFTLKETGRAGVRPPRTSQVEPTNGDEMGLAKGGMASSTRNALPDSKFALPGSRKYPVNNRSHAANAKARASEMENKGRISSSTKAKIDAAANRVLGKARGGPVRDPRTPMISPKSGCQE